MKPQPLRTTILILCFAFNEVGTKTSSSKFTQCICISYFNLLHSDSPSGSCICFNVLQTLFNVLQTLFRQIDRDCEFLESERIMDYSLLVGLHFRDDNTCDKMGLSPFLLRTGNQL